MIALPEDAGTAVSFLATIVASGILGGLIAGLLGVGGGIVIVPVFYHLLGLLDVDDNIRMHVAVATSLGTIIATSAVSVRSHYKRGAIDFSLLRSWGLPIFVGVMIGTAVGGYVDSSMLTAIFATVAFSVAIFMAVKRDGIKRYEDFPNGVVKGGLGLIVGGVSALMGIGGGTLSVPILTGYGFDIRKAVGTASAIGFIIAVPGTIGYVVTGIGVDSRPPFSLGYVNVAAALVLVPLTMAFAPVGARIAHAIPRRHLQVCFSIFLSATALSMFYGLM